MTQTEEKPKRTRSVDSGPIVFDELPPAPERKSGGGGSEFDTLLADLHANRDAWDKPVSIRRYVNETAAKAAANVLRQRNGRTMAATGHEFAVRNIDDVWHLFVIYSPSKIVDGAYDAHVAAEKERVATIQRKQRERDKARAAEEKAKAQAEGQAHGQQVTTPAS